VTDDRTLLTRLAGELHRQADQESTVQTALRHVLEIVPDADAVSVTVRSRRTGTLTTIASTGEPATSADAAQNELDEGPCVEAAPDQHWHRSGDVATDARWPQWGPRVAQLGIASVLSVPMSFEGLPAGAINLYAVRPGAFDSPDVAEFAALYAAHLAMAVGIARKTEGLQTAMHSRHRIGIAQGILVATYDLSVEQSFALLRRYSSTTNTKINALAEDIIKRRTLPGFENDGS
jgi:GAF domain-containing protein